MEKDKKIKVLLCSPYGGTVGGISRWTGHILNYYQGIESNIILKQFYPESNTFVNQNSSLLKRSYAGIIRYIPFIKNLNYNLKNNEYNIVHLVSSASISLIRDILALKVAKKNKVKTIIHFRFGRIPEIYSKQNWEYKLLHKVITLADVVIVIDKKSYNTLVQAGYKNIRLLPNPLTPKVTELTEKNKNIKRKNKTLLFAGHTVATKGVFELVEVCKSIPNIQLKMIGHVFEETKVKLLELAGEGNEKWLTIAGEQDYETTIKEMLTCGVFVLPTYTEGFPNVIIESMACGCPIVSTNVGAIPEMLDIENGENYGLCVEPKNVKQLHDAILRMLNDKDFAAQCGSNAQKRVNELYSMPKVWQQMEQIWMNTIK